MPGLPFTPLPPRWTIYCAWCKAMRFVCGAWGPCARADYDAALADGSHGMCPPCADAQWAKVHRLRPVGPRPVRPAGTAG